MKFKDIITILMGNIAIWNCIGDHPVYIEEDQQKYLKMGSIYDDCDIVAIDSENDLIIVYLILEEN